MILLQFDVENFDSLSIKRRAIEKENGVQNNPNNVKTPVFEMHSKGVQNDVLPPSPQQKSDT